MSLFGKFMITFHGITSHGLDGHCFISFATCSRIIIQLHGVHHPQPYGQAAALVQVQGQSSRPELPRAKSTSARPNTSQQSRSHSVEAGGGGIGASAESIDPQTGIDSGSGLGAAYEEDADLIPKMRLATQAFGDVLLPFHPLADIC